MKLYYWEMTSGKRVHSSFYGKGKAKRKWRKVEEGKTGAQEEQGRLIQVEMVKSCREENARKRGVQVSLGEWSPTSTHLCTNPMARVLILEHKPDFTALLCTNKTSACKISSKLLNQSTESIKWH